MGGSSPFILLFFRSNDPLLRSTIRSFNGKISPLQGSGIGEGALMGVQTGGRPQMEAVACPPIDGIAGRRTRRGEGQGRSVAGNDWE